VSKAPIDLVLLHRRMLALQGVTFAPGTSAKRFVRETCCRQPEQLTDRQRQYVESLCFTFRKQLPDDLVPAERPVMAPKPLPPPKPPAPMRAGRPRPKRRPDVRPDLLTR